MINILVLLCFICFIPCLSAVFRKTVSGLGHVLLKHSFLIFHWMNMCFGESLIYTDLSLKKKKNTEIKSFLDKSCYLNVHTGGIIADLLTFSVNRNISINVIY